MNVELLKVIGTAQAANALFYVSQAEGLPLVQHNPPRYRDENDIIKPACELFRQKSYDQNLAGEFIAKLFGMFAEHPDSVGNIIQFRRKNG